MTTTRTRANPMLIGISGNYGAGKDTVAQLMLPALGVECTSVLHLAAPLKVMAYNYFRWDGTKGDLTVKINDAKYIGGRQLLQGLGRLLREELNRNYWIEDLDKRIQNDAANFESQGHALKYVLIPDLRFLNEAIWVTLTKNGKLIRVRRPGCEGDSDSSEREMNSPDFLQQVTWVIDNNGTLEDLRRNVRYLCDELTK